MFLRNRNVRGGSGAGYVGDRWESAIELNERGAFYFLAFECLVEHGSARENLSWGRHPRVGYNSLLMEHVSAKLPIVYGKRDQSTEQYGRRCD